MSMTMPDIIYTITDEAPALATRSLLPIVQAFSKAAGVSVETRDISLAGRILSAIPQRLTDAQKVQDDLSELGELVKDPKANIIKLPNISASIPQLKGAIAELQAKGFDLPDYPEEPENDDQKKIQAAYAGVLGSAVNPVLRQGNSDRRVADAVKAYARQNPHSMGAWSKVSKSHVAHMSQGDFFGSEKSAVMDKACSVNIDFTDASGKTLGLKKNLKLAAGEVIDASVMNITALRDFFETAITNAKDQNLLLSLHLKATMMKVSDPYMFGQAVSVYFKDVFNKHDALFSRMGVNPAGGLGELYAKLDSLPKEQADEIRADIDAVYKKRPALAMVDSDNGITNLHVPSDVIVDASMPACLRASGKMWGPDGALHDTCALIPDRCYAGIYQQMFEDCRANGAFDVSTMGTVSNVGLMAKKAEEYGSHDKTFIMEADGKVTVSDETGAPHF